MYKPLKQGVKKKAKHWCCDKHPSSEPASQSRWRIIAVDRQRSPLGLGCKRVPNPTMTTLNSDGSRNYHIALAALLTNALAWPIILLDYVIRLPSRKFNRRAQMARNPVISTLRLDTFIRSSESASLNKTRSPFSQPLASVLRKVTQVVAEGAFYGQLLPTFSARNRTP